MDAAAYKSFLQLDETHFWRVAKRRLVLRELNRVSLGRTNLEILDIGGACSKVTAEMKRFGHVRVVDPEASMVNLAHDVNGLDAFVGSLPNDLPVANSSCDVITLLDVLEHVEDHLACLKKIRQILMPGGVLICNVPAYMFLWSDHDDALHHKRRYTKSLLASCIQEAGFRVEFLTYWNTFLFPLVVMQRSIKKRPSNRRPSYDVRLPHPLLNSIFQNILQFEAYLLKRVPMPFGSSILAVCRK